MSLRKVDGFMLSPFMSLNEAVVLLANAPECRGYLYRRPQPHGHTAWVLDKSVARGILFCLFDAFDLSDVVKPSA
jgi:hypothetical protein